MESAAPLAARPASRYPPDPRCWLRHVSSPAGAFEQELAGKSFNRFAMSWQNCMWISSEVLAACASRSLTRTAFRFGLDRVSTISCTSLADILRWKTKEGAMVACSSPSPSDPHEPVLVLRENAGEAKWTAAAVLRWRPLLALPEDCLAMLGRESVGSSATALMLSSLPFDGRGFGRRLATALRSASCALGANETRREFGALASAPLAAGAIEAGREAGLSPEARCGSAVARRVAGAGSGWDATGL